MADGRIVVRGADILAPPLLDSPDAVSIEFRDQNSKLVCFWRRVFKHGGWVWGYGHCNMPEWNELCILYGYTDPAASASIQDVLTSKPSAPGDIDK